MKKYLTREEIKLRDANFASARKNRVLDAKTNEQIRQIKINSWIKVGKELFSAILPIILLFISFLLMYLGYIDPGIKVLFYLFDKFYK